MTKAARKKVLLKNLVKARKAKTAKRLALQQEITNDGKVPLRSLHAFYIQGKVETIIEYYCVGKGISPATLASELGELLRHSQGR